MRDQRAMRLEPAGGVERSICRIDATALALSYTGSFLKAYSLERVFTRKVITLWGRNPRRPRWNFSLTLIAPFAVKGT